MKKKVIIIGAGPAGLTAAYYLLKNSNKYSVIILEKDKQIGGISKTVNYQGNLMDLGGHRFFTKSTKINKLWQEILPIQGKGCYDDLLLNNKKNYNKGGPDPENVDEVLLIRNRISRIYYLKKLFDYPVNLSLKTIKKLGFSKTFISCFSYIKSMIYKKEENNLENFYINRFGKKLYTIFFKDYTEKLWGRSPKEIDSSWGSQRVKGLSIKEVLKNLFFQKFNLKNNKVETSLINEFYYPKYGPGQMWDVMATKIKELGGEIYLNAEVVKINICENNIKNVIYFNNNVFKTINANYYISSMPIKDLINCFQKKPARIKKIANKLPYRDFIIIGITISKINLKNETNIKTINNIIPDCWIYVQSSDIKLGRIQIFNNWSPYLVKNINDTISLGLEYFCNKNDEFWQQSDNELIEYAKNDLIKMEFIDKEEKIIASHVEKVEKAYPAYFDSYKNFPILKDYLNKFNNLFCIGRNGCHRYNNMDHSMETAITCIDNILNNNLDKENIWAVNTEQEYHEVKNEKN